MALPQEKTDFNAKEGAQRWCEEMLDAEGHELVEMKSCGGVEDDDGVQSEDGQHRDECSHGGGGGQLAGRGVLTCQLPESPDGMPEQGECG